MLCPLGGTDNPPTESAAPNIDLERKDRKHVPCKGHLSGGRIMVLLVCLEESGGKV